jgi:hypothetical protein
MRILIIALGRSGGHQLNMWLSMELGYKMMHEPKITLEEINEDNIVVKCVINKIENINNINTTNWDKIIGLTRVDTKECAISHIKAIETINYRNRYNISNEWLDQQKLKIIQYAEQINKKNNYVNGIKEIELKVTYEGIYDTKEDIQRIKDYIGIIHTKYEYLLDNRNRLRDMPINNKTNNETGKIIPIKFL